MSFDSLDLIRVPVKIAGTAYVLQEATAGAARDYRNEQMKKFKISDGKMTGMEGAADLDLILVSLCLFQEMSTPGVYQPVPLIKVQEWPDRVVKALATKAKDISDLEDKDTLETVDTKIADLQKKREQLVTKESPAKNEQSATTASSV